MDSRQRFLNTLKGLPIDRFFRYDHGPWPSTRERWLKEGYPADAVFGTYFDMDPMTRFAINSGYCDSPYHPKFDQETLSEGEAHILYRDGDGIIKRVLKTQTDTSMPNLCSTRSSRARTGTRCWSAGPGRCAGAYRRSVGRDTAVF